jgi:type VI protein secretion system component VasK
MAAETLAVKGYRDLLRALRDADRETRLAVRATLLHAGEATRAGAAARITAKNAKTAGGYRVRVRQRGVAVEQSLRKSTGIHPEWGAYQMRHALLPALAANAEETDRRMAAALDVVAERFNRPGSPV